jgi:hypothetical protein
MIYRLVISLNIFPYFTVYAGFVEVPEKSPKQPSEVNVNPLYASSTCKKPLIHMYEKEFTSEIYCGSLWGEFVSLKLSSIFLNLLLSM